MTATTTLLDHHRDQLLESAIDPEIIEGRGYFSVEKKVDLKRLGFGQAQLSVPALVIPIRNVHGDLALYQARPDTPRIVKGKAVKYETPAGAGLVLDVPLRVRDKLRDPKEPLYVTEGSKKVDSANSHGLPCIGVVGVYGWRGTNEQGGKAALPDLECIAWNDRKVYLAFDSDAMEKPEVHQALDRFASLLTSRGAQVRFIYIPSPDGRKVGLDDYLAGGGTVEELLRNATSELHKIPTDEPEEEPEWEPSPEALAEAKRMLKSPDLLERAGATIKALGYAGETTIPRLVYLAITSRILDRPLNLVLTGPTSAGKSYTIDTAADLFPERAIYRLTASSERALIYTEADLSHRVLILGEMPTIKDTRSVGALILKGITWEGRVVYETVESTAAGTKPVRIEKPGPTGFLTSTTGRIDPEIETRVLTVHVSDTRETTREIMTATAARFNGHAPEPPDLASWHALQWWLATEGDTAVTIPYIERLVEMLSDANVRQRRDTGQLGTLLQVSAILHQRQRDRDERARIVATRDDYEIVHQLTADLFGAIQAEGITDALRRTVRTVKMLAVDGTKPTVTQVARELKLDRSTVSRHVSKALDGGWLVNTEERKGRPAKLEVGDPLPENKPALPTPDDLFTTPPPENDYTHTRTADSADTDAENERVEGATRPIHAYTPESEERAARVPRVYTPLHTDSADVNAENVDSVYACSGETEIEVCASCGVELLPAERKLGKCFPCSNPAEVPF